MTPPQRKVHLAAWGALGVLIALTLAWSLALRARAPVAPGDARVTEARP